jgi:predicted SAM-dependent methyltransferase
VYIKTILLLSQAAAMVPVMTQSAALLPWKWVGSWKFRTAYRKACEQGFVCLHVGSKYVRLNGCLNTDIMPAAPLYLDASKRLPIKDNTADYIFGEHVIEYLPRAAAIGFFRESYRVLKPGGVLRISTPDIGTHARAYLHDPESVRRLNERNRKRGYRYTHYPVDIFNKTFFEDENVCEYDAETLMQMLGSVGFRELTRCEVGESQHCALRGVERHDVGSIADHFTCVIEATKLLESEVKK